MDTIKEDIITALCINHGLKLGLLGRKDQLAEVVSLALVLRKKSLAEILRRAVNEGEEQVVANCLEDLKFA